MKKLTLHRETLKRLDAAHGGLPITTTRLPAPEYTTPMTCAVSCMRNCDFTTDVPR